MASTDSSKQLIETAFPAVSPPNQFEFEQAVLGAALMSAPVAQRLPALCASEDFDLAAHRFIYAAICELVEQGKPVDVLTVPQHLRQADMLERVGGTAYFALLTDATPTARHVDYYAKKVREAGEQRALIAYSSGVRGMAEEGEADPAEIVAKAEEQLTQLRRLTMRGQARQAPMTYAELMAADLPEPEYLITRMFPQGCTLLHSVPKEGKSRLVSELAVAATTGGLFLGTFPVKQTGALCLFMEDSQPETQARFKTLTEQGPRPQNLHVAWDWETMDRGGLERLDQFLSEHPAVRLLVVDTLEYIRPPITKDGQLYSQDVAALRKLKDLADKYAPCYVVILHHSNKSKEHSDDVILSAGGTNGIAGSCDTIMQLQGKPDGTKVFRGKGRRIPPFAHVTKMDDRAGYQYLGEAETVHRSREETDLLEALASSPYAMKERDVGGELGISANTARERLRRAAERGFAKRIMPATWEITLEGRGALKALQEAESARQATRVQSVQSVQPVCAVQPPTPCATCADEGIDDPAHPAYGAEPADYAGFAETAETAHELSPPQTLAFLSPLEFSDETPAEERQDRETTWQVAGIQGFPPLQTAEGARGGGEDAWRLACLTGPIGKVRAALRALERMATPDG